jgi:hypothetical protein
MSRIVISTLTHSGWRRCCGGLGMWGEWLPLVPTRPFPQRNSDYRRLAPVQQGRYLILGGGELVDLILEELGELVWVSEGGGAGEEGDGGHSWAKPLVVFCQCGTWYGTCLNKTFQPTSVPKNQCHRTRT